MKYIKTYEENKNLKYQKGDYVIMEQNPNIDDYFIIKIVLYTGLFDYYADRKDKHPFFLKESGILRKLTDEEVREIEAEKNMKKYNL